ncbi:MAG TPA: hypothetical protein VG847_00295 [Chitinophagaceae bacterium]|nr:hypothetical protein [Chitinophagaceae bacterium]
MKKILALCLVAMTLSATAFANPTSAVTEKVLKVFHAAFPEAKHTTWYAFENYYEVYFKDTENSSCRIDYTPDGDVICTTRYYAGEDLSPAIRAKVSEKFPDKKIYGVTEVSNTEKLAYHIVLEDEKNWYNIESDATGNIRLDQKMDKPE